MSVIDEIHLTSKTQFEALDRTRVLGIALAFATIYITYKVFIYPFYVSPYRHLPEPKGAKFPWGHAEVLRHNHNGGPLRKWANEVPNNGLIRLRLLFNRESIFVTGEEPLKELLVTRAYDFEKPEGPNILFRTALGNGLLASVGSDHKVQRKSLLPSFAFRNIKELYPLFLDKAQICTAKIAASTGPQNALDWAKLVTLDIIGVAAMGYDFNALEEPNQAIVSKFKMILENEPPGFAWTQFGLDIPIHLLIGLPVGNIKRSKAAAFEMRQLAYDTIRKIDQGAEGKDILSVARRSGQFDEDGLVDQCMTFLAAGHETTASALTWATYILCKHPEIQNRLREEIRVLDLASVTAADIDALPYLNAFCSEVLRVIPSVPSTLRDAIVDTTIQGLPIAKGTRFLISPWATNTDPKFWGANGDTFNPERWLVEGQSKTGGAGTNYANMTFIHGPRSCIGKDFARAEFLCLTAAWFGRFEVKFAKEDCQDMDVEGWVTVHPKHKLPVIFTEIPGW